MWGSFLSRKTDVTRTLAINLRALYLSTLIFPAAIVLFSRLFFTGRARCTNKLNLATDDKQNITRSISHLVTMIFYFKSRIIKFRLHYQAINNCLSYSRNSTLHTRNFTRKILQETGLDLLPNRSGCQNWALWTKWTLLMFYALNTLTGVVDSVLLKKTS